MIDIKDQQIVIEMPTGGDDMSETSNTILSSGHQLAQLKALAPQPQGYCLERECE
ncbi:hypothetical protein [Iodidimonas sp. SYSU 1G8]|uniref:hypothetical protein n=1 Tax=Iodidimonas sp. SYSU 1G8 TaxID=3133967 RepID=UPI0031FE4D75